MWEKTDQNNSEFEHFLRSESERESCKLYKGLKQKSSLTLSADSDSGKLLKELIFRSKIWLYPLNQNMAFSSFEQNGWKWCNDTLITVTVWFTESQLPPTVRNKVINSKMKKHYRTETEEKAKIINC